MIAEELAFIREIAASPDEILPRLIYADWLDDLGDPRGEFIRLECQLAREAGDQCVLLQRDLAQALLVEYRAAWVEALGPGVMWHEFRLGLVDDVMISSAALLGNGGQVLRHAPLTGLIVRLERDHVTDFVHLKELAQLKRLRLWGGDLGDAGLRMLLDLADLSRLRELSLSRCGVSGAGLRLLEGKPFYPNYRET